MADKRQTVHRSPSTFQKQLHAAKLAATAVRSAPDRFDDDDADAGMSSAAEEVVAPPLIAKPKKSAKPAAPPPPPVEKPKKSAAPVKGAPTGVKRPVEAQSSDDDESATEMVVKERKKKSKDQKTDGHPPSPSLGSLLFHGRTGTRGRPRLLPARSGGSSGGDRVCAHAWPRPQQLEPR